MDLLIRPARDGDAARLREIAGAAKAYWGYDAERVRTWAESLTPVGEVEVAEAEGVLIAWMTLLCAAEGRWLLEDLWVDPPWIGNGVGRALFCRAAARAREFGASTLELEAEPNAVGFYQKMGAHRVGERLSSWHRMLPVMRVEL